MRRPELSLVIPIYNEEAVLPQLDVRLKDLLKTLGVSSEVVFVNDGSKDQSIEILRRMAAKEPRYRVIGFSRNFGHQRAITAGVDKSRGQAVVVMDADLQDPPEVILQMVEKWHAGYDVVYGRRRSRAGESWFKLTTAKLFYRVFAMLIPIEVPLDTGDFRLMSRRVVQTMRGLRETHRFVRGLVAWVGFKQTAVEYDRHARAAGETKYPLRKMIAFAIDGIASFSIQPLRMASYFGLFVGTASVLYAIAAVISWYAGLTVPGWTTTVVLVSFLFSVQFFLLGVLGEYVGRIYEQVKRRPLYIISERINFEARKLENLATEDLESVEALSSGGDSRTPRTARSPENPPAFTPPAPDTKPGLPADPASADVPPPPAALVAAQTATEKELVLSSGLSKPPPKAAPAKPAGPKPSTSVANIHTAPPAKPAPSAAPSAVKPSPSAAPPKVTPSIPPPVPKAASKAGASTPPPPPKVAASVPPPAPKITPSAPPPKVTPSVPPPAPKITPSVPPVASAAADTQKTVSPFATKDRSGPTKDKAGPKDDSAPPDTTKDDAED